MNVDGVKITWVAPEEIHDQRDRSGFMSIEKFLTDIECNEIGRITRKATITGIKHGMWVGEAEVTERIFVVSPDQQLVV